ncbi:hypothetical protein CCAX7_56340 [Capsulimonas corticalis]|uniref:Uncharacterized protein n=1 Tax=Capsulimonas corticalis TaxID=2219043 RepID=A0A402D0K1_9BACT|nr:twin-arginine translocation signal domain-containing protein [Capsulimonas corticalis]BDI33583.1 hypothetical protein CCAX7_56340 [Capsulimonas corticalis]
MNVINIEPIDRRGFLRGAAALAAAATIGMEAQPAAEAAATATAATHSTCALASASGLINPTALGVGGVGTAYARITIQGHFVPANATAALRSVKAHYAVSINGKITDVPMYAWAASSGKPQSSTIKVPVGPGAGVLLSVEIGSPQTAEDYYFLSAGSTPGIAKLVPGTYAIVAGTPNLSGCRLTQYNGAPALVRGGATGPVPVDFEYVLVTVAGV